MFQASLKITKTRQINNPTYYVEAINTELATYAYDEDRADELKGQWREKAFAAAKDRPLDLEIGTGVGYFFAHHSSKNPERLLVGVELKFKPLVQCIRRTLNLGVTNARVVRYHASFVENLFAPNEINNVYVHHPDPWTKRKKSKHRLLNSEFLKKIFILQKPGSFLDIKTDSKEYFIWLKDEIKNSPYAVCRVSEDLHHSKWADENYVTQFEQFALNEGQQIFYLRAHKN